MPQLRPFRALRYASSAGDLSALIAPPYDVIDDGKARELRGRDPHNAVRLILPEGPAPERYDLGARRLEQWTAEGVLRADDAESVTVYRQTFEDGTGGLLRRTSLFAALQLEPFGEGRVHPHERTHAGPKRDRLELTLRCRAQLSAVFLLASDSGGELARRVAEVARGTPSVFASTPDGVRHELWTVGGPTAEDLCRLAGSTELLVADGHHRYETALEVRRRMPERRSAASVLACVASDADPGVRLMPTHRVLDPPAAGATFDWPAALRQRFVVEELGKIDASEAELRAAAAPDAMVVVTGGTSPTGWWIVPRSDAAAAAGLDGEATRLACLAFDRLALTPLTGLDADAAASRGALTYVRDPAAAVLATADTGGAAFLLPPVPMPALWRLARQGLRLPPKSTFFEPKVPSGLLFRPL